MTWNRRRLVGIAAICAVGVVGVGAGIARAVGGSSEEPVTGPAAAKARTAALEAAGGGTVLEIERQDGDGPGAYEVEVRRTDGSQIEIRLDDRFRPVGTAADDDRAGDETRENDPDGS
jgi:hypothetical protein